MKYEELMEQANAHTIAVSEAMRSVELANAVLEEVSNKDMTIAIFTKENGVTTIDDIIGEDMTELKALAAGFVKIAYNTRVSALEKLTGISKELPFVDVPNTSSTSDEVGAKNTEQEQEASDAPVVEEKTVQEFDWSEKNLAKLFITDDMTVKEICTKYGIGKGKLYQELGKYGLTDKKKTMREDAKFNGKRP